MKTATVKVKGFSRSTDLKMISVQADGIKSVNRCQAGQQDTTAIFEPRTCISNARSALRVDETRSTGGFVQVNPDIERE